jgi:IMP dehydrogenase
MSNGKIGEVCLTYDDILLRVMYSDVDPATVSLETELTADIKLKIPLVSAAMDTVTESTMAIGMALEGGVGIIHKNMTPERQAEEVAKVKRFENGFIEDPVTLSPDHTLDDARAVKYSGIPITADGSTHGRVVGLLTKKDFYFDDPGGDKIADYMTTFEDLVVGYEGISLEDANKLLKEHKRSKVIIINNDSERKLVSIVTRTDLEKNVLYPYACKDPRKRLRVGAAIGPFDVEKRVPLLIEKQVDVICVDTAHGHTKNVIEATKQVKEGFDVQVIAGNVATTDGAKALADAGADAVKVGIGPGSICTTRVVAGVGVPQATAVIDCVNAVDVPVIADGGVKYSGDIAKAIGLGASSVMIGSLFAGTDEAPGEIIITEDMRRFKSYRGMGSIGAMRQGSADRYFQQMAERQKLVPEGIEGMVPSVGPLRDHIYQMIGGLRQAMGYVGATSVPEMRDKAEFIRATTSTAQKESHPRVPIIKKAPNYPT